MRGSYNKAAGCRQQIEPLLDKVTPVSRGSSCWLSEHAPAVTYIGQLTRVDMNTIHTRVRQIERLSDDFIDASQAAWRARISLWKRRPRKRMTTRPAEIIDIIIIIIIKILGTPSPRTHLRRAVPRHAIIKHRTRRIAAMCCKVV